MENTININGIEYKIEKQETPEDVEARGLGYLAAEMRKNNITRTIYMTRPNGKRLYMCNQFNVYGKTVFNKPFAII